MSVSLADVVVAWRQWMIPMAIQVSILVAVVMLLERLFARWMGPRVWACCWSLVAIKLLIPPSVSSPMSVARWVPTAGGVSDSVAATSVPWWEAFGFFVWLTGCIALGGIAMWRYRRLHSDCRRHVSATLLPVWIGPLVHDAARQIGLKKSVVIYVNKTISSPAVCGFFRPVILLPSDLIERGSRRQLEHSLLHELTHLKRRDPLRCLAWMLIQLAYWFHPLVWLARRRAATLREICCDQSVVGNRRDLREGYIRTLLEMARTRLEPETTGLIRFFQQSAQLIQRIDWLRTDPQRSVRRTLVGISLWACLLMCWVPLSPGIARPLVRSSAPAIDHLTLASDREGGSPGVEALPSADSLQGCLQRRYLVYGMLARQNQTGTTD